MNEQLTLSFEPKTIEHLGLQMYSTLPAALAELVANSYDADAKTVTIAIEVDPDSGKEFISVEDDGHGMSIGDLNEKYLRIGRNRRADVLQTKSESGLRNVSGKKGIGKLALFGIGRFIRIKTSRSGIEEATVVELVWADMMASENREYHPHSMTISQEAASSGTRIEIRDLTKKSKTKIDELAKSLSRLFDYSSSDFKLFVASGGDCREVTPDLRFDDDDIQFVWSIPESLPRDNEAREYFRLLGITGTVVATHKTLRQSLRGVTVYVNGRRANDAEFYGAAESSYAFSYLSGTLNADYLDDLTDDVISTDRSSINWEMAETDELRKQIVRALSWVASDWRRQRNELKKRQTERRTGRDLSSWVAKQRGDDGAQLGALLDDLTSDDIEMSSGTLDRVLSRVGNLVPEYARLHWRHLHPEVKKASKDDYERQDYLRAVDEVVKEYSAAVRQKSGVTAATDDAIMSGAYGLSNLKLDIFAMYLEGEDGTRLTSSTGDNMRRGQMLLSQGVVAAFRNPLVHTPKSVIEATGIIDDEDCLDILSVVSHLWNRLDNAVVSSN
ncbi:TIGR02391 family protein [Paeniglutamicibacter sulfureus]|uniref:TIGR02391 family protein n=1 Tax=Paeniglutamicibacter sulfureus TaxID=43666 RepID=UPI0026651900|nr:TIGR02391 family protein [Paeniglutamicibacter sulfureus]MDO2934646.1 TIGR02391 family protein [Paeniglutamicibacter sulfureus]